MIDEELFQPFKQLIEIEILGETKSVPENNYLLRCFQYLSLDTISYGDFCWNGECSNCQVWLEDGEWEKPMLACRTVARKGIKIVRLSDAIKFKR